MSRRRSDKTSSGYAMFSCDVISFDDAMGSVLAQLQSSSTADNMQLVQETIAAKPAEGPLTLHKAELSSYRQHDDAPTAAAGGVSSPATLLPNQRRASNSPLSRTFTTSTDRLRLGHPANPSQILSSRLRSSPVPSKFAARGEEGGSSHDSSLSDAAPARDFRMGRSVMQSVADEDKKIPALLVVDEQQQVPPIAATDDHRIAHVDSDMPEESSATPPQPPSIPAATYIVPTRRKREEEASVANSSSSPLVRLKALVAGIRTRSIMASRPITELKSQLRDLNFLILDASSSPPSSMRRGEKTYRIKNDQEMGDEDHAIAKSTLLAQERLWKNQLIEKMAAMSLMPSTKGKDGYSVDRYVLGNRGKRAPPRNVNLSQQADAQIQKSEISDGRQKDAEDLDAPRELAAIGEDERTHSDAPPMKKMLRRGDGIQRYKPKRNGSATADSATDESTKIAQVSTSLAEEKKSPLVQAVVSRAAAAEVAETTTTQVTALTTAKSPAARSRSVPAGKGASSASSKRLEVDKKDEPRQPSSNSNNNSSTSAAAIAAPLATSSKQQAPSGSIPPQGAFSRVAALSSSSGGAGSVSEYSSEASKNRSAQIEANLKHLLKLDESKGAARSFPDKSLAQLLDDTFLAERRKSFVSALFTNPDQQSNVPRLDAQGVSYLFDVAMATSVDEQRCTFDVPFEFRRVKDAVDRALAARN